jgi:hypothetical protein
MRRATALHMVAVLRKATERKLDLMKVAGTLLAKAA